MASATTEMLCVDCDKIVLFEQPDCGDGFGDGDLMCVMCGAAVTFGGMLLTDRSTQESSAA